MGEYAVPPNSANTLPSLAELLSAERARLRTYSRVGIPYWMIESRAFVCFFCFLLRWQQNHSRTDRIEIATTPLTTPAIIGTAELLDDDCGEESGDEVADAPSLKIVCVDVGVTTVEVMKDTDVGRGDTVAVVVVVSAESGRAEAACVGLGVAGGMMIELDEVEPVSGHAGVSQENELIQQPTK